MNRNRGIVAALAITSMAVTLGGRARADFTFGEPVNLGPEVNTASAEALNCTSADHLELYFGSDRPGGFGNMDLWVSRRQSIEDSWGPPVNLGAPVNSEYIEAYPSLTSDGLTLYFSDLYSGTPRPNGLGGADIWMTTRVSLDDPWTTPVNVGAPINGSAMDVSPTVSGDGLILVFASSRTGTGGPYDLWMSTRETTQNPWSVPINLGTNVNSAFGDLECSLSADGLALFFPSARPGGLSEYDMWMTTRKSRQYPWTPAVNVGPMVNDIYSVGGAGVSADMRTLYFDSKRPGGFGSFDIWAAPIIPIVDFNSDGLVDGADVSIMIAHWHTDNPTCDIGPAPWGDGIVDVQDLIVLNEYLSGLLAYWMFDETEGDIAYDTAGHHDGVLVGNPVWQPDDGTVAGALAFDGVDDYVVTKPVLNPANGSFSVFAWIKGGAPGQAIISQTDGKSWLRTDSVGGCLMTELKDAARGGTPLFTEESITDGAWHRIGFVWDGSCRHLYVDGLQVAIDIAPLSSLENASGGLYFGAGSTLAPGTFFFGLIDDIRIYSRIVNP